MGFSSRVVVDDNRFSSIKHRGWPVFSFFGFRGREESNGLRVLRPQIIIILLNTAVGPGLPSSVREFAWGGPLQNGYEVVFVSDCAVVHDGYGYRSRVEIK